jgi:hypothetical protein
MLTNSDIEMKPKATRDEKVCLTAVCLTSRVVAAAVKMQPVQGAPHTVRIVRRQ